jgi:hypothetical protein
MNVSARMATRLTMNEGSFAALFETYPARLAGREPR